MKIFTIYNGIDDFDWFLKYKSQGHEISIFAASNVGDSISGIPIVHRNIFESFSVLEEPALLVDSYYDLSNLDFKNNIIVKKTLDCDKKQLVKSVVNIPLQVYFYEFFKDRVLYDLSFIMAPISFWRAVRRVQAKWVHHNYIDPKHYYNEFICNFCISFFCHKVEVTN